MTRQWLKFRAAGVLLHLTCLPRSTGIGGLGRDADEFIETLHSAKLRYWQMCPIGPTGFGDSPYQSFSAFAGNPYLIDLEALVESGCLQESDLDPLRSLPEHSVDYGRLYTDFFAILRRAWQNFSDSDADAIADYGSFAAYCADQAHWLDSYAEFQTLKARFGGKSWIQWPVQYRLRERWLKQKQDSHLLREIQCQRFYQYIFSAQWNKFRRKAAQGGVQLVGDIPIFVAADSADVWAHRELFQLQPSGQLKRQAGVPPDYFSPTGQLWGNPLYNWQAMRAQGYAWWVERLRHALDHFDVVRLDHFRGFCQYWSVPAAATDASGGRWQDGPGIDFFESIAARLKDARLIAEDLGDISEDVVELLRATGLPGMGVLQFAFDGRSENTFLPHMHKQHQVVYTGTHDNNTSLGWYQSLDPKFQDQFRRYFRVDGSDAAWDLIRAAYASVARLAIIPLQDFLNLDSSGRFNLPSTSAGNWQWRATREQIEAFKHSAPYLRELAALFARGGKPLIEAAE